MKIEDIIADIIDVATRPAPIAIVNIINRHREEEEEDEGD